MKALQIGTSALAAAAMGSCLLFMAVPANANSASTGLAQGQQSIRPLPDPIDRIPRPTPHPWPCWPLIADKDGKQQRCQVPPIEDPIPVPSPGPVPVPMGTQAAAATDLPPTGTGPYNPIPGPGDSNWPEQYPWLLA